MQSKILETGLCGIEYEHRALKLDKQGSVKAAGDVPWTSPGFKSGREQCTRFDAHSDKMDRQSCQTSDCKVI